MFSLSLQRRAVVNTTSNLRRYILSLRGIGRGQSTGTAMATAGNIDERADAVLKYWCAFLSVVCSQYDRPTHPSNP